MTRAEVLLPLVVIVFYHVLLFDWSIVLVVERCGTNFQLVLDK